MAESTDAVQAQLAKLKRKYGLALPEKISSLEAAFAPLFAGSWEEQVCSTAYRQVHSLAGSSGTYGYTDLGLLARSVEALIKQSLDSRSALPAARKAEVDGLMAQLREQAMEAARQASL